MFSTIYRQLAQDVNTLKDAFTEVSGNISEQRDIALTRHKLIQVALATFRLFAAVYVSTTVINVVFSAFSAALDIAAKAAFCVMIYDCFQLTRNYEESSIPINSLAQGTSKQEAENFTKGTILSPLWSLLLTRSQSVLQH